METKEDIQGVVNECFGAPKRTLIPRHTQMLSLGADIRISRKSIKYIVDSRKDDGYGIEKMRKMFQRIRWVLWNPDVDFPNPTQKYPGSRIAVRRYLCEYEALIVVYDLAGRTRSVFNCYYRPEKKLRGQYRK